MKPETKTQEDVFNYYVDNHDDEVDNVLDIDFPEVSTDGTVKDDSRKIPVYISYSDYDDEEWFAIYSIATSEEDIKKNLQEDLTLFIKSLPDDVSYFKVVKIDLTSKELKELKKLNDTADEFDPELQQVMEDIDQKAEELLADELLSITGYYEFEEIVNNYCLDNGLDPEDDDDFEKAAEELTDSEDEFDKRVSKHVEELIDGIN